MGERCGWARTDLSGRYHDEQWGVPVHDDRVLFEFLVLEGAQAGLSWETILRKRDAYRDAFEAFDPARVARFDDPKIDALLANQGLVRNRLKIRSAVRNARSVLQVQETHGSLDAFLWSLVDGAPIQNRWESLADVPAQTPESEAMSKALKARGFNFVGPTICYAFMQAVGMVNNHLVSCPRHRAVARLAST